MKEKKAFTVIGAGVVGLCCAVALQRKGHNVVLIDRLDPGTGTSFGNGGLIQIDAVVPIATPGILRSVPRMLLDQRGPLVIRWRYLHKIAPWILRFLFAVLSCCSILVVSCLTLFSSSFISEFILFLFCVLYYE